jgi:DtxR family Mn-dependent transcriptional regulator
MKRKLSSTLEDYLIAIHRLEGKKRVARPRDIGHSQKVAKSTVTAALRSLADKGLVNYQPYEAVTLTAEGRKKAQEFDLRHRILNDFLEGVLGLSPGRAHATACGMEHALEPEVVERFVCFLAFVKQHSTDATDLQKEFRRFVRKGGRSRTCRKCVRDYLKTVQSQSAERTNAARSIRE